MPLWRAGRAAVWAWRVRRALAWAPLAALLLAGAAPAGAQTPSAERSFSLEYHAPADCPDGLSLVTSIQGRTAGAALVAAPTAAVRLKVDLTADGQSTLWVFLKQGSFRRQFSGAACVDAVASIAVIASMVLEAEPAARQTMAEAPEAGEPGVAAEPAAASVPAGPTQPEQPAPPVAAPPPAASTAVAPPARAPTPNVAKPRANDRRSRSSPNPVRFAALGGGSYETAVAPSPPFGGTLGLEVWHSGQRFWNPGLTLEFAMTMSATEETDYGDGVFRLMAGRLKGCPLRLTVSQTSRLIPCLLLEVGSLRAEGQNTLNRQEKTMPWIAGGVALRAQVDITKSVALEASAAGKTLARHDKFVFEPGHVIYEVPVASFGLGLGLTVGLY